MVCCVHDRLFLAKFHGAVNKLRQTNEFPVATLRQLPKLCCSCSGKTSDMSSTTIRPILKSADIDALRLMCLWFELSRCITIDDSPSQSETLDYTILPFSTCFEPNEQAIRSNEFIVQEHTQLYALQNMHNVHLQFVTWDASEKLRNLVLQLKCDLIAKCSNYSEAVQTINGLWIMISVKDDSRIGIVKHILQQQWKRFITKTSGTHTQTAYDWRQNLPVKITNEKCSRIKQRSATKYQNHLKRQQAIQQARQRKPFARRPRIYARDISLEEEYTTHELLEDEDESTPSIVETIPMSSKSGLWFFSNKYQDACKYTSSRSHRRQQMLAFAILA